MQTKLSKTKLFSRLACLGAIIVICSGASAQSLFVSGRDARGGEIFKFTWDGQQSIFASGLYRPSDLAFDNAGNLFVVDYLIVGGELRGNAAIFKATPNGTLTIFAFGVSYASSLAIDKMGNVFVADYDNGIIYQYKPTGSRAVFASGLHHPAGMAFNTVGNLFVADNSPSPGTGTSQGYIYETNRTGRGRPLLCWIRPIAQRTWPSTAWVICLWRTWAVTSTDMMPVGSSVRALERLLAPCRPAHKASRLTPQATCSSWTRASGTGSDMPNAIYKFTSQGTRSAFASGLGLSETFARVAFPPMANQ